MKGALSALALALLIVACDAGPHPVDGVYTWGAEVNTFAPCGADSVYWVAAASSVMDSLRAEHSRRTSAPYEGIHVSVTARAPEAATDGFALDYDGVLEILTIERVGDSIPAGCR